MAVTFLREVLPWKRPENRLSVLQINLVIKMSSCRSCLRASSLSNLPCFELRDLLVTGRSSQEFWEKGPKVGLRLPEAMAVLPYQSLDIQKNCYQALSLSYKSPLRAGRERKEDRKINFDRGKEKKMEQFLWKRYSVH